MSWIKQLNLLSSSCLRIFVFISLASVIQAANTTQPAIDPQLLKQLETIDAKTAQIKDLTADFEQKKFSPLLKKPITSKGTIFVRGTAMLWDTVAPEPTRMRIDATSMQIYYANQKKVEQYPLKGKLASMAANPLPRLAALMEQFDIKRLWNADAHPDDELLLILFPRHDDLKQYLKQVVVNLDPNLGVIKKMELTDPDGERTEINFTNPKINQNLADAALDLNAAPGTETVQPLGPAQ